MDWNTFLKVQTAPVPTVACCEPEIIDVRGGYPPRPEPDTLPKGSYMFVAIGPDGFRRNMIITEDGRTCALDEYLDEHFAPKDEPKLANKVESVVDAIMESMYD